MQFFNPMQNPPVMNVQNRRQDHHQLDFVPKDTGTGSSTDWYAGRTQNFSAQWIYHSAQFEIPGEPLPKPAFSKWHFEHQNGRDLRSLKRVTSNSPKGHSEEPGYKWFIKIYHKHRVSTTKNIQLTTTHQPPRKLETKKQTSPKSIDSKKSIFT